MHEHDQKTKEETAIYKVSMISNRINCQNKQT